MTASYTTIPVASERCCSATLDGSKHLQVQPCQPKSLFLDEVFACRPNDIGHLDSWPIHCSRFFRERLAFAKSDTPSSSSGFGQACR